jgi:hypothetical protein
MTVMELDDDEVRVVMNHRLVKMILEQNELSRVHCEHNFVPVETGFRAVVYECTKCHLEEEG